MSKNICVFARVLLASTSALAGLAAIPAMAQQASEGGLEEIIVTAQKREQSLQDVPIAVTALSGDALQANRVANVADLSGLAPNLLARSAIGGGAAPAFSMRGVLSFGVVPGADKQVSIYLDGVYISSPRGSLFELPDIQRIEVLRGPQGTLFGRNATAGAMSVVTRDPTGEIGARQQFTFGNFNQFQTRTTIDLPRVGPFSAFGSFVYSKRRGDIRNLGAGTSWDRTGPDTRMGQQISPKYLGSKNVDSWFAALKFEPSDNFTTTYKFDKAVNHFTPEGVALVGYNKNVALLGNLIDALVTSNEVPLAPNAKRPEAVQNGFTVSGLQRNIGHSLTSILELGDNLTVKNIAAYRKTFVTSAMPLDGMGSLTFTPQALVPYATFAAFSRNPALAQAAPEVIAATIQGTATALAGQVGQRFSVLGANNQSRSTQWSDELQVNYDSDLLTVTAGALYFKSKDTA